MAARAGGSGEMAAAEAAMEAAMEAAVTVVGARAGVLSGGGGLAALGGAVHDTSFVPAFHLGRVRVGVGLGLGLGARVRVPAFHQ